ncbi:hypothetical protein ABTY92_28110, partial [Escherichia coli]
SQPLLPIGTNTPIFITNLSSLRCRYWRFCKGSASFENDFVINVLIEGWRIDAVKSGLTGQKHCTENRHSCAMGVQNVVARRGFCYAEGNAE